MSLPVRSAGDTGHIEDTNNLHSVLRNLLDGVLKADLPTAGTAGRLARVTDDVRGVWMDQGSQWFSLSGETVYARQFLTGDGSAETSSDIDALVSAANGKVLVFESGYTFDFNRDGSFTSFSGVRAVVAYGATLLRAPVLLDGDNLSWFGGTIDQGSGTDAGELVSIRASNLRIYDALSKPASGAAHVGFKIRNDGTTTPVENIWSDNCETRRAGDGKGSFEIRDCNGVTVKGYRGSGGSDDGVVVKSINAKTENVLVNGVRMRDHGTLFAIGDQCVVGIENIKFAGGVASNIGRAIKFRPGFGEAVGSGDCRNIQVDGAVVIDADGSKMLTPITLQAGDGTTLEGVHIDNLQVWGRFADGNNNFLAQFVTATGTTMRNISIADYRFTDPEGGVASGSAVGHPATRISDSGNAGTLQDITLEGFYVNGHPGGIASLGAGSGTHGTYRFIDPVFRNLQDTTNIIDTNSDVVVYLEGGDFPSGVTATSVRLGDREAPKRSFSKQRFFGSANTGGTIVDAAVRLVPQDHPPSSRKEDGDIWYSSLSDRIFAHFGGASRRISNYTGQAYSESNVTTDRTFDADNTTINELADVLGTLIADLRAADVLD